MIVLKKGRESTAVRYNLWNQGRWHTCCDPGHICVNVPEAPV